MSPNATNPSTRLAALFLLAALASPSQAALSPGNAVEVTYLFPNTSTTYAGPVTVTGGTSLSSFAGILNINFTDSSILMTLSTNAGVNAVPFDGLRFTDVNASLSFANLALDVANTSYAQFTASRVSLQGNSIFINLAGLPGLSGQQILLSAPAVPEPASWALMLGGLAVAAGLARRRG